MEICLIGRHETTKVPIPWALYCSDSISDDVQPGKLTSFPQAVQLKDGEVIALAWVVYRSKEDRDRISKAVMEEERVTCDSAARVSPQAQEADRTDALPH